METIFKLLDKWKIRYSYEYNFVRVYGNFDGYSIVRANADDPYNPIEID